MKLMFKKNESSDVKVLLKKNGDEEEFSYIEMIKGLIVERKLQEPEIEEGFSEAEISSIKSMVKFINQEVEKTEEGNSSAE